MNLSQHSLPAVLAFSDVLGISSSVTFTPWFLKSDQRIVSDINETGDSENQEPPEMRNERRELGSPGAGLSQDLRHPAGWALRPLTVSPFSQRRHGSEEDPAAGVRAQG